MKRIALIGLGAMGAAFAAKWRAAGFDLAVYNRDRAKAQALAGPGVTIAGAPREAAALGDVVVTVVNDDDASRAVWLGPQGAVAGLKKGAVAIEMSTVSPDWARTLAGHVANTGAVFLDAPVAGGPSFAAAGKLALFVGGPATALEMVRPLFAVIGSRIEHLGDVGAGATWKLVNYMMAGAQMASLAEALTVAAKAGIKADRAAELISQSVVASPLVVGKLPRMIERRFEDPEAALRLVVKDQRYALALSQAVGAELQILPAVVETFARAERDGLGDLDLAAVVESVSRRSRR